MNTPTQQPNFNLVSVELETINNTDLAEIFGIDNGIESPDVLDIITQIKKENSKSDEKNIAVAVPDQQAPSTVIVLNNQNVQQRLPFLPQMLFPHSNVTINYNFNK